MDTAFRDNQLYRQRRRLGFRQQDNKTTVPDLAIDLV
jgi:hypothetical protein